MCPMTLVLYYVTFAIHDNARASGVPEVSCDQSWDGYKSLQQNNSTHHRKQSLFPTRILQGQSTCKIQLFTLVHPSPYSDSAKFAQQHSLSQQPLQMVRFHPQPGSREKERNLGTLLGSLLCSVQDPNPQAGAAHIHSGASFELSLSRSLLSTRVCSWRGWDWVQVEPGDHIRRLPL